MSNYWGRVGVTDDDVHAAYLKGRRQVATKSKRDFDDEDDYIPEDPDPGEFVESFLRKYGVSSLYDIYKK